MNIIKIELLFMLIILQQYIRIKLFIVDIWDFFRYLWFINYVMVNIYENNWIQFKYKFFLLLWYFGELEIVYFFFFVLWRILILFSLDVSLCMCVFYY